MRTLHCTLLFLCVQCKQIHLIYQLKYVKSIDNTSKLFVFILLRMCNDVLVINTVRTTVTFHIVQHKRSVQCYDRAINSSFSLFKFTV